MATIKLDIVSPDKGEIFSKDVDMVIVRSTAGELGILPRHAKLLTELIPHAMRIKISGGENLIALGGGFMEVTPEKITVLAKSAELPDDIDVERAQRAKKRAEERIAEYIRHQLLLHTRQCLHPYFELICRGARVKTLAGQYFSPGDLRGAGRRFLSDIAAARRGKKHDLLPGEVI